MKKIIIIIVCLCSIFIIALFSIAAFPQPFVNLYIKHVEKNLDLDIDFSSDKLSLKKEWHLTNVKISSKRGYSLSAEELTLYPPFFSFSEKTINFNCKAKNIKFYREFPLLDAVCALLSIQPINNIKFYAVDANIILKHKKIQMNNLKAVSDDIRIFGNGSVDTLTSLMDYDMKFTLSENITINIPDAVKLVLLDAEDDPYWMSLSVKINGDYKKPHLNLRSGLINLNIKNIIGK